MEGERDEERERKGWRESGGGIERESWRERESAGGGERETETARDRDIEARTEKRNETKQNEPKHEFN